MTDVLEIVLELCTKKVQKEIYMNKFKKESIMKNNDFQEKHIHTYSDFSFIIYKKIEESKTVFIAPHSYITESFYAKKFLKQYFQTDFQPKCRENQIVIFPSFLEHMVKKTSNALTISGNISVKNNE